MSFSSWLARRIEQRLGGYKQTFESPDFAAPTKLAEAVPVAVIGAGIAGIAAAAHLAERGFAVSLFEREAFLGGKVGSWPVTFDDGFTTHVEHGFHAFFRQYHNFRAFLERLGISPSLRPIEDYLILTKDFGSFSFKGIPTTPFFNLLAMAKRGVYKFSEMALNPKAATLREMFKYEEARTFGLFDQISFSDFADDTRLPAKLRRVFTSFARAFFAEPHEMSMAEMIKGFHFYFLSNDLGLIYDTLDDDFSTSLLAPIRRHLETHGVSIHLQTPVTSIEALEEGQGFAVEGQAFRALVLATDVCGTKAIVDASPSLQKAAPQTFRRLTELRPSRFYAVLRLWMDRDIPEKLPVFLFTDRIRLLDSISLYHRMEEASIGWAKEHGGGIFELHSYAVPDGFESKEDVRRQLIEEFESYFPVMKGATIRYEWFQYRRDFTSFNTGLWAERPEVQTDHPAFFVAGDWVKLPFPSMLMEAAHTSGLLAANAILRDHGLQTFPVYTLPLRGLLASKPKVLPR